MIKIANAMYTPSALIELSNNPVAEALPKLLESDEFTIGVSHLPSIKSTERELPDHERMIACSRLGRCVVATTEFYTVYQRVYTLIKAGYIDRNPLTPKTTKWTYDIAKNNALPEKTTADTLMITGISGGGKTTIRNGFLKGFPQVIDHTEYQGKPFIFRQLVYICVDMPHDASRSALCLEIFRQFDDLLETNYAQQYGRKGVKIDDMQQAIATISANHMLGAIIIDEFQNLNIGKSGGKEAILNFFDYLANIARVPIIKIGTPAALLIFTGQFRSSRRAGTSGLIEIQQHSQDSKSWQYLMRAAWRYQWVKQPSKLSASIQNTLYQLSLGIPFCLFRLMELANQHAITTGHEVIDEALLKRVYKQEFGLIRQALSALRTGDTAGYEDLMRCDELLRDKNSSRNIEELLSVVRSQKFKGAAATHLSNHIENGIAETELSDRDRKMVLELKEKLQSGADDWMGSMLIEGKSEQLP